MNINEILQELYKFAFSNHEGTFIQIRKENAINLYYYIDNLEDKEQMLYMILGGNMKITKRGKKNDKSNK